MRPLPTYKYKAVSRDGAQVSGVVEAYDEFEAVARIKENCPVVTAISEVQGKKENILQRDIIPAKISLKALALLCSQFSIILTAGLPVVRSVELIRNQTTDKELKKLLAQVAEDVAGGYGLAQSFENKGGKLLPAAFVETVRSGEESGTLEASFRKLGRYYDASAKVQAKVKSAMMYPIFLSVLAVAVIAVIMVVTMPTFVDMFDGMGIEMPALTRALIAASNFFAKWWWLVLLVIVLIAIGIKTYSATEGGRQRFARLQLRLPALGKVAVMKGASQFANTMSTLLTAGMPMLRSVAVTAKVLDNYFLSLRLGAALPGLEEGRRLGDCLKECGCFPELLVEMAGVGEETGALEETLETIGVYFDEEVSIATNRALSMLQPAITVVMGIVIGVIVIALYLPMFTMYGGMA